MRSAFRTNGAGLRFVMTLVGDDRPDELRLLLACAERAYSGGPLAIDAALLDRVDWDLFVNAAVYHKLGVIAYRGLLSLEPNPLPTPLRLMLARKERDDRARALALSAEIRRLADAFAGRAVPFLLYKGEVAAHLIYAEPYLRKSLDIDVLVPASSLEAAATLLRSQGFTCSEPPERQQWLKESTFEHPDWSGSVDLHWSLVPGYLYLKDRLAYPFEHPWRVPVDGAVLPTLTPGLLVLDLCLQGAKERWQNLSRVVDLAGFIAVHEGRVDWRDLNRTSRDAGLDRVLQAGLGLVRELFPLSIPGHIHPPALSAQVAEIVGQAVRGFQDVEKAARGALRPRPRTEGDEPAETWAFISSEPRVWLAYLPRLASRPGDRVRIYWQVLRHAFRRMFTIQAHDRQLLSLPGYLGPLHLIVKPFRLALKYILAPAVSKLTGRK